MTPSGIEPANFRLVAQCITLFRYSKLPENGHCPWQVHRFVVLHIFLRKSLPFETQNLHSADACEGENYSVQGSHLRLERTKKTEL
jgi:hypothetical protein